MLVLLTDEPGAELVADELPAASSGAASLAEVVGTLADVGAETGRVRELLFAADVGIEPVLEEDVEVAGAIRSLEQRRDLGDRCCAALTLRSHPPEVLTADRAWVELDLPIRTPDPIADSHPGQ